MPLLCGLGLIPVLLPNAPAHVESLIGELDLEGVLFTGGNDLSCITDGANVAPERDRCEAILLDYCAETNLPTFGVCRGLQMMVHHHGGRLSPVQGHVAQSHSITLCEAAGRFGLEERQSVNSFHNFGVRPSDLGEELMALALAGDGTVEALAHATLPRVAVMWHPERAPEDERDRRLIASVFLPGEQERLL